MSRCNDYMNKKQLMIAVKTMEGELGTALVVLENLQYATETPENIRQMAIDALVGIKIIDRDGKAEIEKAGDPQVLQ